MGNTLCETRQPEKECDMHKAEEIPEQKPVSSSQDPPEPEPQLDDPATLKQLISQLNESLTKVTEDRDRATAELTTLKELQVIGIKDYEAKIAERDNMLQSLKSAQDLLQSQLDTQRTNFESELANSQQKSSSLDQVLNKANEENQTLTKEVNDLKAKVEELNYKIKAEAKAKEDALNESQAVKKSEQAAYEQKVIELEAKHNQEKVDLETKFNQQKEELMAQSSKGIEIASKFDTLEKVLARTEIEKETLNKQLDNLKREHSEKTKVLLQDNESLLKQKDTEVNEWKQKYEDALKNAEIAKKYAPGFIKNLEETKSEEAELEVREDPQDKGHPETPHYSTHDARYSVHPEEPQIKKEETPKNGKEDRPDETPKDEKNN